MDTPYYLPHNRNFIADATNSSLAIQFYQAENVFPDVSQGKHHATNSNLWSGIKSKKIIRKNFVAIANLCTVI